MDFEAICKAAGVTRRKTDKGIEIYSGRKKVGTFCIEDGMTRFKYPSGSEYRHSTFHGRDLTDNMVLKTMVAVALGNIQEEARRVFK